MRVGRTGFDKKDQIKDQKLFLRSFHVLGLFFLGGTQPPPPCPPSQRPCRGVLMVYFAKYQPIPQVCTILLICYAFPARLIG